MKTLKLIAIAVIAAAVAGPAFAGRDEALIAVMARARTNELARINAQKGVAGPVGVQGKVGPATSRANVNIGHPSERVRR